jgi:hypothetical protein
MRALPGLLVAAALVTFGALAYVGVQAWPVITVIWPAGFALTHREKLWVYAFLTLVVLLCLEVASVWSATTIIADDVAHRRSLDAR